MLDINISKYKTYDKFIKYDTMLPNGMTKWMKWACSQPYYSSAV